LLSQIASKLRKPDALTVIQPDEQSELAFLHPLPVKWLPGIGPTTERVLQAAGLSRIDQVARTPLDRLSELVGSYAEQLLAFANNIDDRPVENAECEALSYGHQETFAEDMSDLEIVDAKLRQLADEAMSRARADGKQVRTVTVKVRYPGMEEHQAQASLPEPTDVEVMVYPLVSQLLRRVWDRRQRIRMVQIKLSNVYEGFSQLDLFGDKQRQRDLALTCEAIRNRFGGKAMMRAHDWVLREEEE
jgi:DNA polymerase-4